LFARKWILPTILVLLAAAICVRLGIWQLDRLAQRQAFNVHYASMIDLEPLELPSGENLVEMEYRSVVASGTYDFSQQVAIRNQYYRDQYGYHLLTPLVLTNGKAVLVDRGWIPSEGNSTRSGWDRYDKGAQSTVNGIIRISRERADFTGNTDPELSPGQEGLDFWLFPNIKRIQEQVNYELLPVYIQADPDPTEELPIPVQPQVEITEGPHLGYALQWFSFAGILLIGFPFYIRKQSRISHEEDHSTVEEK